MRIDLDIESTGLDWQNDKIILNGYRVDFGDFRLADPFSVDYDLAELLRDDRNELWGHNIKFDALFLAKAGYEINCDLIDTRVMAYICWPELEEHGLKYLCETKLGVKYSETLDDICFKPLKKDLAYLSNYKQYYYELMGKWGRKDKIDHYHREDVYNIERISALMNPPNWFFEVEVPLTKILFKTELLGIRLDVQRLKDLQTPVKQRIEELQAKFGAEFNPNSKDDVVGKFTQLGVDLERLAEKTDSGEYKLDKIFLKRRSWGGCEFSKDMLEHRALAKLNGTYIEPFLTVEHQDSRLRGSFNQAGSETTAGETRGTKTGRLASSNPNLQNITSRTKLGKQIREAFIASEGYNLYDSDLPQIEPRLMAHFSQSYKLVNAYQKGLDTHGLFASDVFGPTYTPTQRFIGKTGWLATSYGCSPAKLLYICEMYSDTPLEIDFKGYESAFYALPRSSKYGWSQEKLYKKYQAEAPVIYSKWEFFKEFQNKFIQANPELWGWRNAVINRARESGYIRTIGGRVIRIDGLDSSNRRIKARAERTAINYLIQGSAADIFKQLTLSFQKLIERKEGRFLAFIHDEWLLEAKKEILKEEWQKAVDSTVQLRNIPLPLDLQKINNWAEKK